MLCGYQKIKQHEREFHALGSKPNTKRVWLRSCSPTFPDLITCSSKAGPRKNVHFLEPLLLEMIIMAWATWSQKSWKTKTSISMMTQLHRHLGRSPSHQRLRAAHFIMGLRLRIIRMESGSVSSYQFRTTYSQSVGSGIAVTSETWFGGQPTLISR